MEPDTRIEDGGRVARNLAESFGLGNHDRRFSEERLNDRHLAHDRADNDGRDDRRNHLPQHTWRIA